MVNPFISVINGEEKKKDNLVISLDNDKWMEGLY